MPRVSVIVPAYNAAWCLGEALDSLVRQTYDDWEAIVADDGSTDSTAALVDGRDQRIRLVRNERNQGLAATRNLALRHATGELVVLLDSDDELLPDYLRRQVARYDSETARGNRVGVVCCDAFLRIGQERSDRTFSDRVGRLPPEITLEALVRDNQIFIGALLNRSAIDEVGGFDASLRSVEDLDMWLRLLEAGWRIVHQPEPLAIYRLSANALSSDVVTMTRSLQTVLERALARGMLPPDARRAALQSLRTQRAAEQLELARREARQRPVESSLRLVRAAPLLARVLVDRIADRR